MDVKLLKIHLFIISVVIWGLVLCMYNITAKEIYSHLSKVAEQWDMYRDQTLPPCNISNKETKGKIEVKYDVDQGIAILHILGQMVYVNLTYPSWADLYSNLHTNLPGGHYRPSDCVPEQKLAILIPYRDRDQHLRGFLQHMHPFLQRQRVEYRIFVIELVQGIPFNRGALFNIGYKEATKLDSFDCFFFHDVDLLPENNSNTYLCSTSPKHFSTAQSNFEYRLPYRSFFGGVSAMPGNQFEEINGFSNLYFGWGGEDDDIANRIDFSNMTIVRNSVVTGRYRQMPHVKVKPVYDPYPLLRESQERYTKDGLGSIQYELFNRTSHTIVTWINVFINQTELCAPWPSCGIKKIMRKDKKTTTVISDI